MINILELNTKIFRKDNLDLEYLITDKKLLNGILHYRLKSENSDFTQKIDTTSNKLFKFEFNGVINPKWS